MSIIMKYEYKCVVWHSNLTTFTLYFWQPAKGTISFQHLVEFSKCISSIIRRLINMIAVFICQQILQGLTICWELIP